MSDPLIRKIRILQMLPREGEGGITTREIVSRLRKEHGIYEIKRNIERDLRALSDTDNAGHFPISADFDYKPYQWSWYGKEVIGIPKMGRHTALVFHLTEELLGPLLPAESIKHLKPNFDEAKNILKRKSEQRTRRWVNKIRTVSRHFRQVPASIKKGIQDALSQALYDERQIEVTYIAASNNTGELKKYVVHPYALLHRESIVELIGRIDGDDTTRRWMLHRLRSIKILNAGSTIPHWFNLDDYIKTKLGYPFSGQAIIFKAWFRNDAINHVLETKLSDDQIIEYVEDGLVVTATLNETIELKWWLLGLGERVKVLEPKILRDDIKSTVKRC